MYCSKKPLFVLRRSTALLSAVLIVLTCSLYMVTPTWAWFHDNSAAAASQVTAALFDLDITVDGEKLSPVRTQNGISYRTTLKYGHTYTVSMTPSGKSTASTGFCLVGGDSLDGYTKAITGPYEFKINIGAEQEVEVTFTPNWGTYSGVTLYGGYGPRCILNDSLINDYGEAIDPEDMVEATEPTEETEPTETEPAETEPAETEPAETEPAETEPAETEPAETEPAETEPAETEPAETEPAETEPAETEPAETEPAETEPAETEPAETTGQTTGSTFNQASFAAALEAYQKNYEEIFADSVDIPMYFQDDYPNVRYGAGSIATSGCGIVSLAMVANYLTGFDYQPDQLARWFGGRAINNMARMETAATALQLPWSKAENFNFTEAALAEGKIVIALMEGYSGNCPFTQSQHFIVLKGLTDDGRILVNDPLKTNYDKWDLKEGFASGFSRGEILSGYSGGWIFDPEEMPENPVRYYEENGLNRDNYPTVDLTFEEQELIAKVIWVEAQGECAEGQQAVAEVILNRLISGRFGSSVESIIYAEGQFRSVPKIPEATPWQAQYDALEAALYGEPVLDKYVYYFATTPTTTNVWGQIGGHIFCYAE